MVIESGAIYSCALISAIATYASGNNAQYIVIDFVSYLFRSCSTNLFTDSYCGIYLTGAIVDRKFNYLIFRRSKLNLRHGHQGVVFTVIILRVGLGISSNGSHLSESRLTFVRNNESTARKYQSTNYPMKPMTFPITVDVHEESTVYTV